VTDLIDRALSEDVGDGDLTTRAVVPEGGQARARITQKAPGVIAGARVAQAVFERVDPEVRFVMHCPEGKWRESGAVAEISGSAASILTAERVALNFLGHLSGVATQTAHYVRAVEGTGARILDTRKTMPGLRALEKDAVRRGGGANHRAGLYDGILVKENHARMAGGVGTAARLAVEAAERAGAAGDDSFVAEDGSVVAEALLVEVECATLAEVEEALEAGVPRILLDNMSTDELRRAVETVARRAELEASGGITLDNVREVAETGVDFISVGAITHSAPALDLSLLLEPL
jgi:nicotinate-nucleotide pyrophosphorylase (carboxylating)